MSNSVTVPPVTEAPLPTDSNTSPNGTNKPKKEPFLDKLIRKFTGEPLVPIGAIVTTLFLTSGFRAFVRGETRRAQILMRGRVLAQGATVVAMCVGAYYGYKPRTQQTMEQKLTASENAKAAQASATSKA